MNKYITIIDHLAGSEKPFTFLENKGENKIEAVSFAHATSRKFSNIYNVKVAKKVGKNQYLPILSIYWDGGVSDLVKNNWNGWGKSYFFIDPDMLET